MVFAIVLLTIAAFVQSSFWHIQLTGIVIVAWLLYSDSQWNAYLAFGAGLFLSFLLAINLGTYAVFFIVAYLFIATFKRSPFSHNNFFIVIFAYLLIVGINVLEQLLLNQPISVGLLTVELVMLFPIITVVRFFNDRLQNKTDLRLRLKR